MACFEAVLVLLGAAVLAWSSSYCLALNFSIAPPFSNSPDIVVRGNATRTLESLQLTSNSVDSSLSSGAGRIYYSKPVRFLDPLNSSLVASFSTWFSFKIVQFRTNYLAADGMAFIIAPDSADPPPGSAGKYLGLLDPVSANQTSNHLFAVEFDTYSNEGDPLGAASVEGDHVGVDINSIISMNATVLPGEVFRSNYTLRAWIDYDSATERLEVRLSNSSSRPDDPLLASKLSLVGVLREEMYVGFSAATGMSSELHKVFNWNFSTSGITSSASSPSQSEPAQPARCWGIRCKRTITVVAVFIVSVAAISVAAVTVSWYLLKKPSLRKYKQHEGSLVQFNYDELSHATKGFNSKQLLGSGGCGKVYRGVFSCSTVAVKVLRNASVESEHQFLAELAIIGKLQHPNLVRLIGWSSGRGKLILVYDFLPNGCLHKHLFAPEAEVLSWERRYQILTDVAKAIQFLHEGEEHILHRDIKAANVLLDSEFKGKLGDFGLARLMDEAKGLQTMTQAGTTGYIAPELAYLGKGTEKSDVYSFGILSLEIVTGRRTLDASLGQEMSLLDWVWHMHESSKLLEVVDTRLSSRPYEEDQVRRVLHMAIACCHIAANCRPTMRNCCEILECRLSPPVPPDSRPENLFCSYSCKPKASSATGDSSLYTQQNAILQFRQMISL